jgi:hypothetical protein
MPIVIAPETARRLEQTGKKNCGGNTANNASFMLQNRLRGCYLRSAAELPFRDGRRDAIRRILP